MADRSAPTSTSSKVVHLQNLNSSIAAPPGQEIATLASDPYVPSYQNLLQPTDEVLAARGGAHAIKVYDEIRRDAHAFAILQKRKLEVVSREWNVKPPEEATSRLDKKAAAEVERQFKALDFDRLTRGLMGAVLKGFSVAEIMWELRDGVWTAAAVNRVAGSIDEPKIGLRGSVRVRSGESVAEVVAANELGYFFQNAVA